MTPTTPAAGKPKTAERGAGPLNAEELRRMHAWWRACNYLAVGMIYLRDNPLLREPLSVDHVKHRLLGHWGASPALSFVWAHLNRVIKRDDLDVIFMAGPGHGAPGVLGPAYLEGTYSEIYPDKSEDAEGMQKFFKQFSFPGHIGSHVTPETPGSIHEGGELGYSLSHAYGAALDNPDLIVACVVGDGEAETGPLATAWHSNKFINPVRDGAVLPILNLNGYKIANPTILARISHEELEALFVGYGYTPYFVEGSDPAEMHQKMAATLDAAIGEIRAIQKKARDTRQGRAPALADDRAALAQGLDRPKEIKGHKAEGSWRSHQVPFSDVRENPASLKLLENWLQELPAGGAVRRQRPADAGAAGAAPDGHAAHERQPARQRRPAAQGPEAAGLPRLRGRSGAGGQGAAREHQAARRVPARRDARQHDELPRLRSGRDRLQPPAGDLRGEQEDLDGRPAAGGRRRRRAGARRPGHGDALRAHADRLAGRLSADRPARLLPHLRSLRARDRLDVQPARQVAGHLQEPRAVAGLGRLAEHPAVLHGLAPGPQRLLAPGPRLHRPGDQQEPERHAHLPAAGRQHAAGGGRPVPALDRLHQRHRRRQAEAPAVHHHRRGHRPLRQGHRHLGAGEHRRRRGAGRGDGLLRRRRHPGGARRRPPSCASICRI